MAKEKGRLKTLSSHTVEEVRASTGFEFALPAGGEVPCTPEPDATTLALIRGRVREEIGQTYPSFAATLR